MLSIDRYREIYRILDSSAPAVYDCGTLCGAACCNGASFANEESYIYLLPGEMDYLESVGCELKAVKEKHSDHNLPKSWGEYVYVAHCPGKNECKREVRPIQCRTFPLQPYISPDGEFKMILCNSDLPYSCPFIEGEVAVSEDFHRTAYEAWSILIEDDKIRDLVKMDSEDMGVHGTV
ncbi:MAG: hypothetical protein K5868_10615 [Lachnospiraceae bacterium]|nr:hypothetical protein [Lachnospiraceae bacterium]